MIMKKSILFFAALCILCIVGQSQSSFDQNTPLILITEEKHSPVDSLEDINQISQTLQNIKALTISTQNIPALLAQLKQLTKTFQINKQQLSSLMVDQAEMQKLKNFNFQNAMDIEDIKKAIQKEGQDLLIQISQNRRQQRKLVQNSQILTTPKAQITNISPLFSNMDAVTLTGLLVSLFLLVILLVAVKCLYEVKTNDQFGRNNLWVGKQS